ncbi:MAG: nucleotidyltransferase family protein [Pseudomonadales bacterium]|nr:nucleotidyltransferase family protein [Pseudomonadales bacterium]
MEAALAVQGWQSQSKDAYDEHYYREWMHEIPPLVHRKENRCWTFTTRFCRRQQNIILIQKNYGGGARGVSGIWTLCPEDLVIHSATHLFHDGELEHGLRDLVDIHELLQYFAENEAGFWTRLVPRAIELDLFLPLYYGLYYAQTILNTAIPESVMQHVSQGAPNKMMRPIMDWLFLRALRSAHSSCDLFGTGFARWILYVRSHYLRMPLTLLIPHLIRKAWKRRFKDKAEEPNEFLRGAPTDRDPLV